MHVILVHGWKGWPDNGWFPWVRKQLEGKGYTTEALAMPNPILPDRDAWVRLVRTSIKGSNTILIGHSLGCPAILLALEQYDGPAIHHVIFVSGFGRAYVRNVLLEQLSSWFRSTIDFKRIISKSYAWSVIHSRKDPLVPFAEGEWLAEQLGTVVIEPEASGHLVHEEGCFALPEVVDAISDEHVEP